MSRDFENKSRGKGPPFCAAFRQRSKMRKGRKASICTKTSLNAILCGTSGELSAGIVAHYVEAQRESGTCGQQEGSGRSCGALIPRARVMLRQNKSRSKPLLESALEPNSRSPKQLKQRQVPSERSRAIIAPPQQLGSHGHGMLEQNTMVLSSRFFCRGELHPIFGPCIYKLP